MKWLTSDSGCFTPEKELRYHLSRGLDGTRSQSGRFGEAKNLLPMSGFKFHTIQLVAWAITTDHK